MQEKKTILLVEDEAIIALTEAKILKKHGFNVTTVHNGEKAVKAVAENTDISLILMDIDLGSGIDGTEAAKQILKNLEIPIVFLTSHSEKEYVDKVKKITGYGYVLKNSGEFVLIESIHMAFKLFDAYQKSKRNEELLDDTGKLAKVGGWEFDIETMKQKWTRETYNIHELPLSVEPDVERGLNFFTPESKPIIEKAVQNAINHGIPYDLELSIVTEKGNPRWVHTKGKAYYEKGKIYKVGGSIQDITKIKRTEDELIRSKENLRITLDSIGDAVIATDIHGKIDRMNPMAERLTGWILREAEGKPIEEVFHIIHADTWKIIKNPVENVLESGEILGLGNHTVLISKNGKEYQIADSAAPIRDGNGQIKGVVLVFRDVTEEYHRERQLKESEEKYRAAFMTSPNAVNINRMDGLYIDINVGFTALTGYTREDVIGKLSSEINIWAIPEDREKLVEGLKKDGTVLNLRSLFRCKDGSLKTAVMSARVININNEAHILSVTRDVTLFEQKQEEVERATQFLENISDIAYEADGEGNVVYVNAAGEKITGLPREKIVGNSFLPLFVNEDRDSLMEVYNKTLEGQSLENILTFTTGITCHFTTLPKYDKNGNITGTFGIARDITERKKSEMQKDIFMDELNHRVKNNLMLVSSLIDLKDSAVGTAVDLSDIKRQVDAIRIVHEKLYQADDISRINIRDYLRDLLSTIFSFSSQKISLNDTVPNITLPTRTVGPLGLIINEVATNAMKHGFSDSDDAVFSIDLKEDKRGYQYTLTLENSGKPFPKNIDLLHPVTLGLQLINALVTQIEGTIELQREPHPVFTIRFPMEEDT